jgi:hypothetical protein
MLGCAGETRCTAIFICGFFEMGVDTETKLRSLPMKKGFSGYALGFLIIILIVVLGLYVAYTGFVSSREILPAGPTSDATVGLAQQASTRIARNQTVAVIDQGNLAVGGEVTATLPVTPALTATAQAVTPTLELTSPPTARPSATIAPPSIATDVPVAQPAGTPEEGSAPPTPAPATLQQFRLGGPPAPNPDYPICCYIYGAVRDAAGNPLEGVRVQALNEWTPPAEALTKGGGEIGQYDIPINESVANWEIVIVDAAGTQISSKVPIQFDATVANGFRVDWQRTN